MTESENPKNKIRTESDVRFRLDLTKELTKRRVRRFGDDIRIYFLFDSYLSLTDELSKSMINPPPIMIYFSAAFFSFIKALEIIMKKAIVILITSVIALTLSVIYSVQADGIVAPNTPVSAQKIQQYIGAPEILTCLGTNVPDGYVITKYEQSSLCGFFPSIPGIQMTFTQYEDLDTFTACSGSPYPQEGEEGGYVIVENKITTDCVLSNKTPGYASVYRSVESLLEEDDSGFVACTNSQMPYGFGHEYYEIRPDEPDPCHDGYRDEITSAVYINLANGGEACARSVRPPKNVFIAGAYFNSIFRTVCGAGEYQVDENTSKYISGSTAYLYFEPINGQSEITVCPGWGRSSPEGYVLTEIKEYDDDHECYMGEESEGDDYIMTRGFAHVYTLPIYTILP
ncbi:MAG: hypothetical protein LBS40_01810 [Burkholderiales bacterium]|nr:hypothetical protein [Burkholderiales bacterium]